MVIMESSSYGVFSTSFFSSLWGYKADALLHDDDDAQELLLSKPPPTMLQRKKYVEMAEPFLSLPNLPFPDVVGQAFII